MALSIVLLEDGTSRLDTEDGTDSLALQDSDSPTALQFDDNSGLDPLRYQAADLGGTFTVCFWVRPTGPLVATDDRSIWCQEQQASTSDSVHIEQFGADLQLLLDFSSVLNIANVFAADTWTFIALTSDVAGITFTVYYGVPGETLHSATGSGFNTTAATQRILIAGVTPFSGSYFRGDIAGMRIWNTVLTGVELQAEADSVTAVKTASLWASWKLDSSANKLVDSGPSSRTLTALSTGPWTDINDGPPVTIASGAAFNAALFPYPEPADVIRRVPSNAYRQGGEFFTPVVAAAPAFTTIWDPEYPDFARAAPRALNAGGVSWTYFEREPTTDWSPSYPDFARAAQRAVNQGGVSWTYFEREPAVSDWSPEFPDSAPGARRALNTGGQTFDPAPIPPAAPTLNLYEPEYPDFARAVQRPVNQGGAFWTYFEREPTTDWAPSFPDFARAVRQALNVGGAFNPLPVTPAAPAPWEPEYPDFARAPRRALNVGGAVNPHPGTPAVPAPWDPEYPDFARARARSGQGGPFFVYSPPTVPAPQLWAPSYPDFAPRRTSLAAHLASFSAFVPLVTTPSVGTTLLAHWRCDDTDPAVMRDCSGNGFHLAVSGSMPVEPGRVDNGRHVYRDPNTVVPTAYARLAPAPPALINAALGEISVAFWARWDNAGFPPGTNGIVSFITIGGSNLSSLEAENKLFQIGHQLVNTNGLGFPNWIHVIWERTDAGVPSSIQPFFNPGPPYILAPVTGRWYHYAVTRQTVGGLATMRLYIDGMLQRTMAGFQLPTGGANSNVNIGFSEASLTPGFAGIDGMIDDFRVYSGVLTDAEVLELFLKPLYTNRGQADAALRSDARLGTSSDSGRTSSALGNDARLDASFGDDGIRRDDT